MEPWEDELLWDDDFSDEGEDTEEQIEETDLEMDADGFADWEDASDAAPVEWTAHLQRMHQRRADRRIPCTLRRRTFRLRAAP